MTATLIRWTLAPGKFLSGCGLIFCLLIIMNGACSVDFAQSQQQGRSREINSEDYAKSRPSAGGQTSGAAPNGANTTSGTAAQTNGGQSGAGKRRRRVYHLAYTNKSAAKAAPAQGKKNAPSTTTVATKSGPATTSPTSTATIQAQVGITIWRLRPPTATEVDVPKIQVRTNNGVIENWTAARAASNAQFAIGERVWLSIESPQSGYLYVIDREQYANGKVGEAMLIFPTTRTRDNRVSAGVLIDLPGQDVRPSYFTLKSDAQGYAGEALTVIITPQPIAGLTIGPKPLPISEAQLKQWETEWETETEVFEMDEGAGTTWTKEEQTAGSAQGRTLTQEEPTPQTIYRINIKPDSPLLINVPLRARATQ